MEKLLTPREVADRLGVKVATVYTWAYRRQIPVVKVRRVLRFSPQALADWLAGRQGSAR